MTAVAAQALWAAARVLEHHPRQVTALIAACLLGGGGAAFAVASFGPDPSALPVREVVEPVEPLALREQSEVLDAFSFSLWRSDTVRPTDTVESLLARLGVSDPVAATYLRQDPLVRQQLLGRYGRSVRAEATDQHALRALTARWVADDSGNFKRLVVQRGDKGKFTTRVETAPLTATTRLGSGTIRSSLFAAVDDSRLPDEVAVQLADILSAEIDFRRGLRKGDRFSVVYEALEADGEPLRTGRVLSAEFLNNGHQYNAVWFQQAGKGAYYGFDGKSLTSSYLASPMEFSRVTSGFAMRFHPIMKTWRAHTGVDYGAPTGTAVRTVGDGIVEFAGVQNGYGNVVMVRHNPSDITVYAHLSRVDVRRGQSVAQGQRIGAVGSTGWATGPHLHFEFRINGTFRDPIEVARKAQGTVITAAARPAFDKLATSMRAQLEAAGTVAVAGAQ
ncbi:M23 family metallopeptidase [Ramlibacter algicola]|uniref:M23 family metallopeptidase n=1 Tax=Ramlibacter algicola TaxID=2795217 RepID=A0A934Q5Q3_9BURK|nr:M23 family metallopeptidase [Ramlibacter algicola]MBK0394754.1 M23 family metallopeptidase [Ramlibacter algicola]